MSRLHVFDLDGTLLRGTSVCLELGRRLGCTAQIHALEAAFSAGEVGPDGFARRTHELWRTLTDDVVAAAFDTAPWLAGIQEVWADIRRRGERSAVITLSPDFFARRLLDWGADAVVASRWPALPLTGEPDLGGILGPEDKVRAVDALCARFGVDRADCVGYGDSLSDVPLFSVLSLTVAVNADSHLSGLATFAYQGDALPAAYGLVRTSIDTDRMQAAPPAG